MDYIANSIHNGSAVGAVVYEGGVGVTCIVLILLQSLKSYPRVWERA